MILEEIVEAKKRDVEARQAQIPLAVLKKAAEEAAQGRDFLGAVRRQGGPVRLIAELKKASPSRGLLCPEFSVKRLARAYTVGGASAISVLTETVYFRGDVKHIGEAKKVSPLPVLQKDFFLEPYQVYEAKVFGADAVLLIAAILTDERLREMMELAGQLGLGALVEVHNPEELDRALAAGAKIIGINNRDLRSFRVDLSVTERLAGLVPPEVVLVSESGIKGPEDLRRVAACGVDAILVGEALVTSRDVEAKVRELAGVG